MAITKQSSFKISEWKETENPEWSGGKLTRTRVAKNFEGELKGTAILDAIMLKLDGAEGVMAYVGVEKISCTIGERTGSFVLVHSAEALGSNRNAVWKILPGSGTDGLAGISGHGKISPNHEFTLTYDLPAD